MCKITIYFAKSSIQTLLYKLINLPDRDLTTEFLEKLQQHSTHDF